ncbi:hypothetical protein TNCV_2285121 [Trichonephila clavipes]|nr:hypothetical protein TNCV_2285121 [Trichonephila clavipes]
MQTPALWPIALYYVGEDPWREQPNQNGPTDSRLGLNQVRLLPEDNCKLIQVLFKLCTYISRCMTLRIVLLVDATILRENNAHTGVDRVCKNRCGLVLIHRAFHNDDRTQRMLGKHSSNHNAAAWTVPEMVAGCFFSEVSRLIHQRPSVRWIIKRD